MNTFIQTWLPYKSTQLWLLSFDMIHIIWYVNIYAILHDMIRYSVAWHEKTWYDRLPDTVQIFSLANIIRLWHWPEHCVAFTLRAHLCTKMINYEYNGQPNLICVSLKETIAELISTSDVSVAIHHFDLIVEETAAFLIITSAICWNFPLWYRRWTNSQSHGDHCTMAKFQWEARHSEFWTLPLILSAPKYFR